MGAGKGQNRRIQTSISSNQSDKIYSNLVSWCRNTKNAEIALKVDMLFSLLPYTRGKPANKVSATEAAILQRHLKFEGEPRILTAIVIVAGELKLEELFPSIMELTECEDIDNHVKEAIMLTLGTLQSNTPEARQKVSEFTRNDSICVREAAGWALERLPSPDEAQSILLRNFDDFLEKIKPEDFERYNHYHSSDN